MHGAIHHVLIHHRLGATLEHLVKYLRFLFGGVISKAGIAKFETLVESLRHAGFVPQMRSADHKQILCLKLLLNQQLVFEVIYLSENFLLGGVWKRAYDVSESTSHRTLKLFGRALRSLWRTPL